MMNYLLNVLFNNKIRVHGIYQCFVMDILMIEKNQIVRFVCRVILERRLLNVNHQIIDKDILYPSLIDFLENRKPLQLIQLHKIFSKIEFINRKR